MPDTEVIKVDDHTIQADKVIPEVIIPTKYDYGFLKKQRATIQEQKDRDNAQRDVELAEVDYLIAEADKLGVVEEVKVDVIVDEVIV